VRWGGRWDGAGVVRFTPGGTVDRIVGMPVSRPTSGAFAGPDLVGGGATMRSQAFPDLSHDPANLNYYVTRLSSYYADDERRLALVVLDTMAGQASPTPVPELLNLCKHRDPSLTDEQLREILTALAEDHYIEPKKCAVGAAYDFRWQLVKKWWKERRS